MAQGHKIVFPNTRTVVLRLGKTALSIGKIAIENIFRVIFSTMPNFF